MPRVLSADPVESSDANGGRKLSDGATTAS